MPSSFHPFDDLLAAVEKREFDRPPAIVCNAHITGLGVSRALAAHDVPVIALDRSPDGAASPSTAVDLAGQVTYPLDDLAGFRDDVEALAEVIEYEPVAFACMDEWVNAFVRAEPQGIRLPFAEQDVIDSVLNKRNLYRKAEELGVPYPETYQLDETDPDEAADRLGFPLVVKPARKREFEELVGTNVIEVESSTEYWDVIEEARSAGVHVMAQEKVPIERGRDHSMVSYVPADAANDTLTFVGNPEVRYPLAFGTSCVVSRSPEPSVESGALAILDETGYFGISEAEFVYDSDRETFVLLDINTRPWKWIGLPVAAGVDLPWAAYAEATGGEYSEAPPTDGRWVYLPDYLELLATTPSFGDVFTDAEWRSLISGRFESDGRITPAVYSPSDPGPALQVLQTRFSTREYYCAC